MATPTTSLMVHEQSQTRRWTCKGANELESLIEQVDRQLREKSLEGHQKKLYRIVTYAFLTARAVTALQCRPAGPIAVRTSEPIFMYVMVHKAWPW